MRPVGPTNVTARWVLLGNLTGTAGLNHVGLSEVQVYGRPQYQLLRAVPAGAEPDGDVDAVGRFDDDGAGGERGHLATLAVDGTGLLNTSGTALVHDGTAGDKGWLLNQDTGGLLLNLGAVYSLDALQVWNFNELNLQAYGTQDFHGVGVQQHGAADGTAQMTQVDGNSLVAGTQAFAWRGRRVRR